MVFANYLFKELRRKMMRSIYRDKQRAYEQVTPLNALLIQKTFFGSSALIPHKTISTLFDLHDTYNCISGL